MDKPIPEGVRAIRDVLFRVYMDHDDFEVTTALLHDMAVAVSSLTAAQQPEARGVVDEAMADLSTLVRRRLRQYDSLRDAGKNLGICHVYLHRLATGEKTNPSDDALRKLGISRTVLVTYKEARNVR